MIRPLLALLVLPAVAAAQPSAPYAGLDSREVSRFSEAEAADLLAGRGMGYALAAELNGHPGPTHLLELREELGLDAGQVAAVAAARDRMAEGAQALGARLLEAEGAIDASFEAGGLDEPRLAALVAEAGRIEAELRTLHLAAHLEVLPLLEPRQVAAYARLRGYGAGHGAHAAHGGH